jgi:CBS domain-containing protein
VSEKRPKTLARVRADLRRDRDGIEKAQKRILENLKLGLELGGSAPDLAADAGYTVGRLTQLTGGVRKYRAEAGVAAPKRKTAARKPAEPEPEPAPEDTPPPKLSGIAAAVAELPAPSREWTNEERAGRIAGVRERLHAKGWVSDRWDLPRAERPTLFVDVTTGEWWSPAGHSGQFPWKGTAAGLLDHLPSGVARIYFVGPYRPGVTSERMREHGSAAAAARAWFLAPVEGWQGSHFLADDAALVGRWKRTDGTQEVEMQHAAVWFGHGAYSARDAAFAWYQLGKELGEACRGAVLMSTPSTTGRDVWRRMIPAKSDGYPVLSDELRQLIQTTSGQGRRELVRHEPATLGMVTQYDMRIAYAALTWGMPVGAPEMVTQRMWNALTDEDQGKTLRRRGRWLVRATVPGGWEHVGILPYLGPEGWSWPSKPGTTFTSWSSSPEVAVAREHGWHVEVIEGFHFAEGKPLNNWKDKLMEIHGRLRPDKPPVVNGLIASAVRMMILGTIGAFASRTRPVTHTAAEGEALPNDAQVREVAGTYVWETAGERSEWTERASHPEWSAEIWARCRVRLLETPAVQGVRTGALWVPPGNVIGFRTDGLTLFGDPRWPDDGAPGRYRLTGRARGAFGWPQTDAALSQLKRIIEGAYETGEMQ